MYYINKKRGGFVVLRKSDRKQIHKGLFKNKTQAREYAATKAQDQAILNPCKDHFVDAYEAFVLQRQEIASNPNTALTKSGLSGHVSDLNNRIKPYMQNVLLSEFKHQVMKQFLIKCSEEGHKFKRLQRTVKHIKAFLNVMKAEGKNPCLDMLKFDINTLYEIIPSDYEERFEKQTEVIDEKEVQKILVELNQDKDNDYKSALSFAMIVVLFLFGLRRSELKGLKPSHVDLENGVLNIKGIYIAKEGGYLRRTKNRGSFRQIDIDDNGIKFFTWYLKWLETNLPHHTWLFPSTRGGNPISDKALSNMMWRIYERMGLAELEWKKDHCVVISSPFKGSPTKTFRHRLATALIDAMNSEAGLTANYVKSVVGHTRFTTTQDRYGNHNGKIVRSKTLAKARAIGSVKLIS